MRDLGNASTTPATSTTPCTQNTATFVENNTTVGLSYVYLWPQTAINLHLPAAAWMKRFQNSSNSYDTPHTIQRGFREKINKNSSATAVFGPESIINSSKHYTYQQRMEYFHYTSSPCEALRAKPLDFRQQQCYFAPVAFGLSCANSKPCLHAPAPEMPPLQQQLLRRRARCMAPLPSRAVEYRRCNF